MTCDRLQQLVKSYTVGETAFEVYREQRRIIVDEYTGSNVLTIETTIDSNDNDPLKSFPIAEPEKHAKPSLPSADLNKHRYLYIAAAVSTLLLAVIIIIQIPEKTPEKTQTASDREINPLMEPANKVQLLLENLSAQPDWDDNIVNQFILDWQILPAKDKQDVQNAVWFDDFKNDLHNQLYKQQALVDAGNKTAQQRAGLVTSVLATVDPNFLIAEPVKIADAEHSQVVSSEIAKNSHEEATPAPKPAKKPSPAPVVVKKTVVKKEPSTEKGKAKAAAKEETINTKPYTKLLNKFANSFEIGNVDELMTIFSHDASTNHHTSADEIRAGYADLFSTTSNRDLEFNSFKWTSSGSQVHGNGKYLALLNPKGTNIDQIFSADVSITIDHKDDIALIKNLYLTNQQFSTSLRAVPEEKTVEVAKSPPPKLNGPADDELNYLINQFEANYNNGNIDRLMALFAEKARTNDKNGIAGIREDYVQLFNATKARKIQIKELKWKFAGKKAIGTGAFEVEIQSTANTSPKTYKGQIRISATKSDKGMLITQLLHNTQ